MKQLLCTLAAMLVVSQGVYAENFHTPVSATSSTSATDLWPVSNLIQGPGVGYDAAEPHNRIDSGPTGSWVTDAPGGFPSDFIEVVGPPILQLDLGSDKWMDEVSVWGYASSNANGVSEFSLRFATEAEGPGNYGASISFNPVFFPTNNDTVRQSFEFGEVIKARYVEVAATDNFYIAPGTGANGTTPGGDRVGLSEIAFRQAVPEPATAGMLVLGLLGLAAARRR